MPIAPRTLAAALALILLPAAAHAQCTPPAPTGLAGTQGCNQTTLQWNAVPGATSYRLVGRDFSGDIRFDVTRTTTSYVYVAGAGTTASQFTVSAINGCGQGPASPTVEVNYATGTPLIGVLSVAASDGSSCAGVTVTWNDFARQGTLGFRITRTALGQPTITIDVPAGQSSYTDTSPLEGVTYSYGVAPVNACGAGPSTSNTGFRAGVTAGPALPTAAPRAATVTLAAPFSAAGPGATYAWRRNVSPTGTGGTPVVNGGRITGATTAQLTITDLRPEDAALYACSATLCGTPVSTGAMALVVTTTCRADYDGRNGADLLDIFKFLEEWFAGCP